MDPDAGSYVDFDHYGQGLYPNAFCGMYVNKHIFFLFLHSQSRVQMKHSIIIASLDGIEKAAAQFAKETAGRNFIALYAPMGAGKTTFTSALCRVTGVDEDAVSSPTFAIVNEYLTRDGESIYHFDFYRITRIEEALDIGFYDYIDSGALCIAEWPENIEPLIPEDALKVYITVNPDSSRVVSWED